MKFTRSLVPCLLTMAIVSYCGGLSQSGARWSPYRVLKCLRRVPLTTKNLVPNNPIWRRSVLITAKTDPLCCVSFAWVMTSIFSAFPLTQYAIIYNEMAFHNCFILNKCSRYWCFVVREGFCRVARVYKCCSTLVFVFIMLSISSLASFFAGEQKSIDRGQNHYKSDHIIRFTYSAGIIRGDVQASMKQKSYSVTVSLRTSRSIESWFACLAWRLIHDFSRSTLTIKWV